MRLILILVAIAVAGCVTNPAPSYADRGDARLAAYARTPVCCDDPAQFSFTTMPDRGSIETRLDRQSAVFDFHSGLSPFAAYELPRGEQPYRVRIKSLFDNSRDGLGRVFYPVVALLDDTFIVVRLAGLDSLQLDQGLTTLGGEPGLALTLPIDPSTERERYLVVFTPAALLDAAPEERREGDLMTPAASAWMARNASNMVPPSPYGRLQLLVAPEMPVTSKP